MAIIKSRKERVTINGQLVLPIGSPSGENLQNESSKFVTMVNFNQLLGYIYWHLMAFKA